MANLVENPVWEPGIYQFEQEDVVLGGPDGLDNVPGKQLANRTLWLKQEIESAQGDMEAHQAAADPHSQYLTEPEGNALIAAAIAALVNSSPATLDTLAELATALGNDPNFATSITNLLALKAAIDSPIFTGDPKGPIPAQFDNDNSLAPTAFVQRALGNYRGLSSTNVSAALTAANAGQIYTFYGSTVGQNLTLPLANSVPAGAAFNIVNQGTVPVTVARTGADTINLNTTNGASASSSIVLNPGDSVTFTSNAGTQWNCFGSPLSFGASLGASGYQKLPSGLIIQWGTMTAANNTAATFPIAFPTACYGVSVTCGNITNNRTVTAGSVSLSGFVASGWITGSSSYSGGESTFWIAIGK